MDTTHEGSPPKEENSTATKHVGLVKMHLGCLQPFVSVVWRYNPPYQTKTLSFVIAGSSYSQQLLLSRMVSIASTTPRNGHKARATAPTPASDPGPPLPQLLGVIAIRGNIALTLYSLKYSTYIYIYICMTLPGAG